MLGLSVTWSAVNGQGSGLLAHVDGTVPRPLGRQPLLRVSATSDPAAVDTIAAEDTALARLLGDRSALALAGTVRRVRSSRLRDVVRPMWPSYRDPARRWLAATDPVTAAPAWPPASRSTPDQSACRRRRPPPGAG